MDTDEQVEAFQCAFHFGHALNVEALPGLDVTEDRTLLGTFWRDTAVEAEELEYFATGHPLVEALFGFLRDGPYGRSGVPLHREARAAEGARGWSCSSTCSRPSRRTPRRARACPAVSSRASWSARCCTWRWRRGPSGAQGGREPAAGAGGGGRALKGDEVPRAFPGIGAFVDAAVPVGQKAAEAELGKLAAKAKKAIEAERDAALERMRLSLGHQGLAPRRWRPSSTPSATHYERLLQGAGGR